MLFALVLAFGVANVRAASTDITGWLWTPNIGWISLSSSNPNSGTGAGYGVRVSPSSSNANLMVFDSGSYAWSSNVGWISFNQADVNGCPTDAADQPTSGAAPIPAGGNACSPRIDMTTGKINGWARVVSLIGDGGGWIHLSGTNHPTGTACLPNLPCTSGLTLNPTTGDMTGFTWSPDLGWLSFDANGPKNQNTPPGSNACEGSSLNASPISFPSSGGGTVSVNWSAPNASQCNVYNTDSTLLSTLTSGNVDAVVVSGGDITLACKKSSETVYNSCSSQYITVPPPANLTKQVQLWFDTATHGRNKPATDYAMDNQSTLVVKVGDDVVVDYLWTPDTLACTGNIQSAPVAWTGASNADEWESSKNLSTGTFTFTDLPKGTYTVNIDCATVVAQSSFSSWFASIWDGFRGISQSLIKSNNLRFTVVSSVIEEK